MLCFCLRKPYVDSRRRNALCGEVVQRACRCKDDRDILVVERGHHDHGQALHIGKESPQPAFQITREDLALFAGELVPLVCDQYEGLARLECTRGENAFLFLEGVCHLDHERDHRGLAQGAQRVARRGLFDRMSAAPHAALFAQTCRVDEGGVAFALSPEGFHRVARRAGGAGDDHAFFAQKAIGERRFAAVRASQESQRKKRRFFLRLLSFVVFRDELAQGVLNSSSQRIYALSVQRREQQGCFEAELRAGFRQRLQAFAFVGDDDNPFAAQSRGEVALGRGDLGLRVEHEENERNLFDQRACLVPCKVAFAHEVCACAVDQRQGKIVDDERLFQPVLRHAGAACRRRDPLLQKPIEQRGLSSVGSADDQDFGGVLSRQGHSKA